MIDWDKVADDAEDSPRGLLSELLNQADEITNLIVVFHDKHGAQQVYQNTESVAVSIAMLRYAEWCELKRVNEMSR